MCLIATMSVVAGNSNEMVTVAPSKPFILGRQVGVSAEFIVTNPESGVSYEWEVNGASGSSSGPELIVYRGEGLPLTTSSVTARCRAWSGRETSSWSNQVTVIIEY